MDGFEVYDQFPNPGFVEITGPRSHIAPVDEVLTDVVDLTGHNRTTNFQVSLNFEDGMIRSSVSDQIWVEIRIGHYRKDYTVEDVPLSLDNESYVSSSKRINIRVMAPESLQPALVPDNFRAMIVTQDLDEAALPVNVKPVIRFDETWIDRVKILGIRPSEVTISKINSKSPKQ